MSITAHDAVLALLEKGLERVRPNLEQSAALQADCIDHEGTLHENGYGRVWIDGREYRAHRLALATAHGIAYDELEGFDVLHDCDRKLCCNPEHLRLATNVENVEDTVSRDRQPRMRGMRNGMARVPPEVIDAIQREYVRGCSVNGGSALARKYGVAPSSVSYYVRGMRRQFDDGEAAS